MIELPGAKILKKNGLCNILRDKNMILCIFVYFILHFYPLALSLQM